MSSYLEIWNVTKSYKTPAGEAVIVRDFNLTIQQSEFVSLIGHSGCGKSTVLSMVAGLNEKTSGGIILAGREIDGPGPDRGVVFQSPCLFPWMTALENVLLGVQEARRDASAVDQRLIAERTLSLVGLADAMHKKPAELSSGMRQRVGLARAFALDPKMLLLDEPFGMLDSLTRLELQEVLIELWACNRKTALMVTHDVDEALFLSDRVAMMTSGPAATLGAVLTIPFPRPRVRKEVLEHPDYYPLREKLIGFLESQAEPKAGSAPAPRREISPGNREGSEPPVLPFSRSVVPTNGP
ncbi:MAG TPA: nitrate ABC transporter ATP-binding protein [Planctomycetota bacterium]|nr:nitrate ABC transporter ATP-binding protein [Planctomycetota bacterium]